MSRVALRLRWNIRQRLVALVLLLLAVIGGVIYLSLRSAGAQQQRALLDNIAGRQPVLVHRYVEEVLLRTSGLPAAPEDTAATLIATGNALLEGGSVLAVQGNDAEVRITAVSDATVRAKLVEEARLVHELTTLGAQILAERPGTAAVRGDVEHLVALGHLTENLGHDAVGRMSLLANEAVSRNSDLQVALASIGLVAGLGFVWVLIRQIVRRLRRISETVRSRAAGDTVLRFDTDGNDEITMLSRELNAQADYLDRVQAQLVGDKERDGFTNQLVEAFEMAEEEVDAYDVVERSMVTIASGSPMELLLADSSRAHLKRLAVSPDGGEAGCDVVSPYGCVAVRRANPVVFSSSTALNACPRLIGREGGPRSAVCVPVSFMGKALGVLHATGPDRKPLTQVQVGQISALAGQAGARIGTLRVFQQTQLQANTDGLTGLINRRTFENHARTMLLDGRRFVLAMADLDHFKMLNDTYGHEAGDRALRLFAETLRTTLRSDDLICRFGGEEFTLLLPDTDLAGAIVALDKVRAELATATGAGDVPAFTATFGITSTDVARNLDELLRLGDRALYLGKSAGRDRVATVTHVETAADDADGSGSGTAAVLPRRAARSAGTRPALRRRGAAQEVLTQPDAVVAAAD